MEMLVEQCKSQAW